MLKHRIITVIFLLPIFVLLLFYLSPAGFTSLVTGIMLWAAWEWTFLIGLKRISARFLYLFLLIVVGFLILFVSVGLLFSVVFLWWCFATLLVILYPRGSSFWGKGLIWRGLMGFLVLIPCWAALIILRSMEAGVYNLIFLFILIWSADTAAYFIGKQWGKNKLAPLVSPGKTWQGSFGGLFVSLLIALFIFWMIKLPLVLLPYAILVVVVTVIFSIVGDLFESMLKRQAGIKDSGRLLPGHGGLLDRIDSLTAAAPVFLFLMISKNL